jgi:nucleotidyltransferase/DNA polymerase involved in DNA repair
MPVFALVDCNNFYASCEKLFDPTLRDTPIVVLSNNDGCVVARSAESKTLGVPMGAPWFQLQDLARQHGIRAFSSNYALYADMSSRVVEILSSFTPSMEVYSIDERLAEMGIGTVRQLRDAPPGWIREHFSVVLERTVRELNGVSCLNLEDVTPDKQQIMASRPSASRYSIWKV